MTGCLTASLLQPGRFSRMPQLLSLGKYVRLALGQNAVVVKNSIALTLGGASAAVLGFAYWWLAARSFPPEAVGVASALISTMGLVGLFGEAGFGTILVGETLRHGDRGPGLIAAALLAAFAMAAALGLASAGLLAHYGWATTTGGVLFVAGCALTGLSLVLDQAFIGALRSTLQLYRNIAFSALKLLLLIGAASGMFVHADGTAIVLTWVVGLGASVLLIGPYAHRNCVCALCLPDFRLLSALIPKVIGHHLLNLATQAPALLLPLLVSLLLSPTVNAAFYASLMVLNIALMAPAALTTVLYTVGMTDPAALAQRLRFSLWVSAIFALVMGICLYFFAGIILGVFNPAYPAMAASSLQLFGFGLLGGSIKYHYILLTRVRNRMSIVAAYFAIGGGLELIFAAVGSQIGGLQGLTIGWLLVILVEAGVLLKPILSAAEFGQNGLCTEHVQALSL
jgi:O-antigen/teichoic acid export membrane protein